VVLLDERLHQKPRSDGAAVPLAPRIIESNHANTHSARHHNLWMMRMVRAVKPPLTRAIDDRRCLENQFWTIWTVTRLSAASRLPRRAAGDRGTFVIARGESSRRRTPSPRDGVRRPDDDAKAPQIDQTPPGRRVKSA
jgi:hypothetical protein